MYFDDVNKKYLILDIEGNSLADESQRKITQFAGIVLQNHHEVQLINWYNRNVNLINPYVVRMNKISVEYCKRIGYAEKHLINNIYQLLKNCDVIYAYGCEFDKAILKLMFAKYHLDINKVVLYDVINDVKKYLNPSKNKLEVAAMASRFHKTSFHDALVACYATLHLMKTIETMKGITN